MLWSVDSSEDDEDILRFDSECDLRQPVTRAKWLSANEILVATTSGDLMLIKVGKDSQEIPFLEKPTVYFRTDSAVTDFGFFRQSDDSPVQVVMGQDSGRVTQLCTKTQETKVVTVSKNFVFLTFCVDFDRVILPVLEYRLVRR